MKVDGRQAKYEYCRRPVKLYNQEGGPTLQIRLYNHVSPIQNMVDGLAARSTLHNPAPVQLLPVELPFSGGGGSARLPGLENLGLKKQNLGF